MCVNALSTAYTKSKSLYCSAISTYLLYPLYKYFGSFVIKPLIVTIKTATVVTLYATFLFLNIAHTANTNIIASSGNIGIMYLIAYFASMSGAIFATRSKYIKLGIIITKYAYKFFIFFLFFFAITNLAITPITPSANIAYINMLFMLYASHILSM